MGEYSKAGISMVNLTEKQELSIQKVIIMSANLLMVRDKGLELRAIPTAINTKGNLKKA